MKRRWHAVYLPAMAFIVGLTPVLAAGAAVPLTADPHRNAVGFFDLHVCNWPERPVFVLALFSTRRYAEIREIRVLRTDGSTLGRFDRTQYEVVKGKARGEKRVFLSHFELSDRDHDGWYSAVVELNDGSVHRARDYVIITAMPQATNLNPPPGAREIPLPTELRWDPVPGARFYRVWIRDMWDDGRIVFSSKLLDRPFITLPQGLLRRNGWYTWRVHARDVNEHILLGDFNHGSQSPRIEFTTER